MMTANGKSRAMITTVSDMRTSKDLWLKQGCPRLNLAIVCQPTRAASRLSRIPIASPSKVNAATTAIATRAAATAYSDSSRPVSFLRNLYILFLLRDVEGGNVSLVSTVDQKGQWRALVEP